MLGVVVAVLGAAMVFLTLRRSTTSPASAPPAVIDSLAAMPPAIAYERANRVAREGGSLASLPLYRRALEGVADDFSEIHFNYAAALYSATIEYTIRGGMQVTTTHSSVERVRLMSEALSQLDQAAKLARTPAALAEIHSARGRMLHLWGFPWEAFVAYRQAQLASPGDPQVAAKADAFMELLRRPTKPSGEDVRD